MDSYDAILEHFREAQRRGLDAMSSRFDSIADNFEQAIDAARSAVRDARPADAGDIFPINEVETALAGLRAEAAETTRAAEAAAAAAATAAQAATVTKPVTQAGITLENLQTLDQARSQSELLRGLLPMLAEHVGRAAVLVIRDGVVTAWSGIGFTDHIWVQPGYVIVTTGPCDIGCAAAFGVEGDITRIGQVDHAC